MPRLKTLKWSWITAAAHEAYDRDKPTVIAVDTETTGLEFHDRPFCVTFAWRRLGRIESHYVELEGGMEGYVVEKMLETPTLVMHNAKFDLQKLILAGVLDRSALTAERIVDTETLAALWNENEKRSLKHLARTLLGRETDEEEALRAAFRKAKLKKDDGFHRLPRAIVYPYAKMDAVFTYLLYEKLYPNLDDKPEVKALFLHEMELSLTLLDIEAQGLRVDRVYLDETAEEYACKVLEHEMRIVKLAGEINTNSWQQIKAAFEKLGSPVTATDEATLTQVAKRPGPVGELAQAILAYRHDNKLYTTYLRGLQTVTGEDDIFHPWFRPNGARTGRMSSSGASA